MKKLKVLQITGGTEKVTVGESSRYWKWKKQKSSRNHHAPVKGNIRGMGWTWKIGDVAYQAIKQMLFYYIRDEKSDFRQL